MRPRKLSFEELVNQNKQELLSDHQAMTKIEEQLEKRHEQLTKKIKYVN
ncbi:FbpB family small basic protein [Aquibacillus sediminis]|nr:FbpB family small basic protein [Aquibacillus sediminis]